MLCRRGPRQGCILVCSSSFFTPACRRRLLGCFSCFFVDDGFVELSMMASNCNPNCRTMRSLVAMVATFVLASANGVRPGAAAAAGAFSKAAYADALDKSILYFDLQRSGPLPSWQRLTWRASSGLNDGHEDNVDLSGGYYDAGDNVKFGLPLAFTMTLLSWSLVEFGHQLSAVGQLGNSLNALRWGTDYLLKASRDPNQLWVQVGNPNSDHACWQRPEDMDTPRKAYKVDVNRPGSDVAGETAAALAAASAAFAVADPSYSGVLLATAKRVFQFANEHRGNYRDAIGSAVCPFYCSNNGYNDELLWGAAWLYKATRDNAYLDYLVNNGASMGGATATVHEFSWDSKYAGIQVLLAKFAMTGTPSLQGYKDRADNFICYVLPKSISPLSKVDVTKGGMLLFERDRSDLQLVTAATLLLTIYSNYLADVEGVVNCGATIITPGQFFAQAQQQVDYVLGANPRGISYLVGFGARSPTQVHHRAASIPSVRAQPQKVGCHQSWAYYSHAGPNPNEATGAIVAGPDRHDNIVDVRSNHEQMEPATYTTAPMVGVLAVLATDTAFRLR